MMKTYLKEIQSTNVFGISFELKLFEGDVNEDRKELMKSHHINSVRYFELKELKNTDG